MCCTCTRTLGTEAARFRSFCLAHSPLGRLLTLTLQFVQQGPNTLKTSSKGNYPTYFGVVGIYSIGHYLMAAATAADPKESHHGFVEGTGRYGRAASGGSAGLEPRC